MKCTNTDFAELAFYVLAHGGKTGPLPATHLAVSIRSSYYTITVCTATKKRCELLGSYVLLWETRDTCIFSNALPLHPPPPCLWWAAFWARPTHDILKGANGGPTPVLRFKCYLKTVARIRWDSKIGSWGLDLIKRILQDQSIYLVGSNGKNEFDQTSNSLVSRFAQWQF